VATDIGEIATMMTVGDERAGLLTAMKPAGERRGEGQGRPRAVNGISPDTITAPKTLGDLGVTNTQISRWQGIEVLVKVRVGPAVTMRQETVRGGDRCNRQRPLRGLSPEIIDTGSTSGTGPSSSTLGTEGSLNWNWGLVFEAVSPTAFAQFAGPRAYLVLRCRDGGPSRVEGVDATPFVCRLLPIFRVDVGQSEAMRAPIVLMPAQPLCVTSTKPSATNSRIAGAIALRSRPHSSNWSNVT
jgi:hypothetical protein